MNALIIVDVQNDFMPGGHLEVPSGDRIVPVINQIQEYFDLVVATQDWHPQSHKSFASNHPGAVQFETINLNGIEQTLWPDHCIQGTEGAEFYHNLKTSMIAAIFRKGMDRDTDSYSGFYDNGHIKSTGLSGYLKEKGVTETFICGLAADICVYYTLMDSITEGFKSTLIEDASCPLNILTFESIKRQLQKSGISIINSNEFMGKY